MAGQLAIHSVSAGKTIQLLKPAIDAASKGINILNPQHALNAIPKQIDDNILYSTFMGKGYALEVIKKMKFYHTL